MTVHDEVHMNDSTDTKAEQQPGATPTAKTTQGNGVRVTPKPGEAIPAHRQRRYVKIVGAAAVVLVAGFVAWQGFLRPLAVPIAPVQANVREQVFGLGVTGARVQSNVGFKVSGTLVALSADQGDQVRAGEVLARLDARDVQAQVAVAKAAVVQARNNIDKARADVLSANATLANASGISKRDASLLKSGLVSQEQAQTDESAVRIASANLVVANSEVAVAQAAYQSALAQQAFEEATLAQYSLIAPYDGWVVSRNLELGSMPNPGQSVFTLVSAHSIWAVAYVDERLAGQLRMGQPAQIILRSNSGTPIPGHVERIEVQSDAVNEERIVDVAFDRTPQNIHLAEQAEVRITTATAPSAVLVPAVAITHLQNGRGTVWTVEHGRLAQRLVTFGPQLLDGRWPIARGLPAGAAVVAAPVSGLRVGRAAHIAEATQP